MNNFTAPLVGGCTRLVSILSHQVLYSANVRIILNLLYTLRPTPQKLTIRALGRAGVLTYRSDGEVDC
jgi:hypothetical protein